MSDEFDGEKIAEARIAEATRTGQDWLDLGSLGLTRLPDGLFRLSGLRRLNLGTWHVLLADGWKFRPEFAFGPNRIAGDLHRLAALSDLQELSVAGSDCEQLDPLAGLSDLCLLDCSRTQVSDLRPLADLAALHTLNCRDTQVSDLRPLAGLTALHTLDCGDTPVSDLRPLAGLPALHTLYCGSTQVSDLRPLAGLTALHTLDCGDTPVSDLRPLAGLPALHTLYCGSTQVSDLRPLAGLTALHTLYCSNTPVSDLYPLAGLTALHTLDCRRTQVSDLHPLAGLAALHTLDCSATQVSDLHPLAALSTLHTLNCSDTLVPDLRPLANLAAFHSLDCSNTQVSDLRPLAGLSALHSLDCNGTRVRDLRPLAGLSALHSLDCNGTRVSDLRPLAGLAALRSLDCSYTQVSNLRPLAGLSALHSLDCNGTRVTDLGPLADLAALWLLDCGNTQVSNLRSLTGLAALHIFRCSDTQVSDLRPLAGLTALHVIYCRRTRVSDLHPLAGLAALHTLDCRNCKLGDVPVSVWRKPSLQTLHLTQVAGIPDEILGLDCLDRLRAHLDDLEAGATTLSDAKLLILGNGRSGKTQIARRLVGLPFQPEWDSTHGIRVSTTTLPATDAEPETRLNIWDFGGQDIYHGTHALFVRSRALFLIVWSTETESPDADPDPHGMVFRNHPLPYWADYVRHLGDGNSPVVIAQAKTDMDGRQQAPVPAQALQALDVPTIVHTSAADPPRLDTLRAALREAVDTMHRSRGAVSIATSRAAVQRRIENLRGPDGALPEEYRLIDQATFAEWCRQAKVVSDPIYLRSYLHNVGTLFYQKGLFQDQIVLDHNWALNAIYAVFDRSGAYTTLQARGGQFDRAHLAGLVWGRYTSDDQRLFLSMMLSCGICFVYRRGENHDDTIYIAPDLLPERAAIQTDIDRTWGDGEATASVTLTYPFLHHGLIRGVIAQLGELAGATADYFRNGVCLYDATTRARALLEQVMAPGAWTGSITIRTRDGQADALLDRLLTLVCDENTRLGLNPTLDHPRPHRVEPDPPPIKPERPDSDADAYAVSYAWKDATGTDREVLVDAMCQAAEDRGEHVLRDKTDMKPGERIDKFRDRIGRAGRVFVFLSAKYLRSDYCMQELAVLWRENRADWAAFNRNVRLYMLEDAVLREGTDRDAHVDYWHERHTTNEARRRSGRMGSDELDAHKVIGRLMPDLPDMLYRLAITIQHQDFDAFLRC